MNLKLIRFVDRFVGIPLLFIGSILKKNKKPTRKINKILLIKFWGMGNIVLATPLLTAIREKYPDAQIHFLSLENNKSILHNLKEIDHNHLLSLKSIPLFIFKSLRTMLKLRKESYDVLIDLEQFARISSIFTVLIGAKKTIGFGTKGQGRSKAYSKIVRYNNKQHMVKTFFELLRPLGIKEQKITLAKLRLNKKDQDRVEKVLKKVPKPFLVLHPGTGPNAPERRWPNHLFATLADDLSNQYSIVFTGTNDEKETIKAIKKSMKTKAFDLSGKLNIPQLAGVYEKAVAFIGSDSGPLHLAAAMNTPLVGLYGPNTPKIYGPWSSRAQVLYKNLWCSPCMSNFNAKLAKCINNNYATCIRSIGVHHVKKALDKAILS